jgi:hypothetical protein
VTTTTLFSDFFSPYDPDNPVVIVDDVISSVLDFIDSVTVDSIVVFECVVIGVFANSVVIRGVADSVVVCDVVDSDIVWVLLWILLSVLMQILSLFEMVLWILSLFEMLLRIR